MKIRPLATPYRLAPARAPLAAQPASSADSVLLSSPAPTSTLPAAPGLWGALFGPHGPALAESVAMAERVAGQGLEFRRMGKFLWWNTGWKEATPKQAARLALAGKADRLQVKKSGQDWNAVRGRGDLERLDAFYGHPGQAQPAGDEALLKLEQKGLLANHGAFGAWSALVSGNPARIGDLTVESGEQACLAAYLLANGSGEGLQHPHRAEMLGWMSRQGLTLPPLQAYATGQAQPTLDQVVLPQVTLDEPGRQTLEQHLARHQTLTDKLGDQAGPAWQALYTDGSQREYSERDAAACTIFAAGLEQPTKVYTAALESAGQKGDLQQLAQQAAQLVRGPEALELWQAVAGPSGVEPEAFQLALVSGLDPKQAYTQLTRANLSQAEFASLRQLAAGGKTLTPDSRWTAVDGGWAHSPGGNYRDGENCSLSSQTFVPDAHSRVTFRLEGSTEKGPDKLSLEATAQGQTRTLWSMSGPTSGWQSQRVDLGEYAGQPVSLNFRFTSDHSVQGPGYTLDSLAVRDGQGHALVHGEPARLERAELWKLWLEPDHRAERLAQAAELCPELGSEAATVLGQKLGTRLSPEQRASLRKLSGQFGNRRGIELFGFLVGRQLDQQGQALDALARVVAAGERGRWSASGSWGPDHQDGRLCWTDSPGQDYANNSDTSLEGPILDLGAARNTRLKFDLKTAVENGPDKLTVEARLPEAEWKELATYTGSNPWAEQDLDLSAFDGQQVQLRLRLRTDHSVTGQGVFVAEPRLTAEVDGQTKTLWNGQPEGPDFSLSGLLDSLPPGPEALAHLELLGQVEERVGNLAQAAALYQVLAPSLGQPDFQARRDALLGLAHQFGRELAVATWPVLDHPEVYTDPAANQAVTTILQSARQAGWSAEGTWGLETASPFGQVWSDSPGGQYANSQNTSLTSREFSLAGLKNARLEFLESHQLESSIDKVHVEALGSDGKWQNLKTLVGSQSWTRDQLDLSAFDGQTTKIRFRLETDQSVTLDGIKLAGLSVQAEDTNGQPVVAFRGDPGEVRVDQLLAGVSAADRSGAERCADLKALAGFIQRFGGIQPAQSLWPKLAPHSRDPEFTPKLEAMIALSQKLGIAPAAEIWPTLSTGLYRTPEAVAAVCRLAEKAMLSNCLTTEGTWGSEELPGVGLVWSDSPGRQYDNSRNDSLVTGRVDLSQTKDPFLSFRLTSQLESTIDKLHLEALVEGKWKNLATYVGSEPWSTRKVSLADLPKGPTQFRFRMETDQSVTMDGVKLSDITVREGDDTVLYRGDPGQVDLEGLLAHTRNGQVSTLVALDSMVTRLGSLQAAQKLWPLLAPFDQDPAFEERAMVLAELAASNGVAAAARVWPLLDDGHLYRDRQIAEAIDVLSSRPPEWTTQGPWGTEVDPAYGPVWSDSPGGQYGNNTDASLITPEFAVTGSARLSFALRTQTESVDKLKVEVAGQDGKWNELEGFSGKSDWRQVSYDLSAYQGQTARLRFHFTSDQSVTDEGVQLANIRVASPDKVLLHGDPPGPPADDLFARLASQPADQRRATILGLAGLADKVGGLQPATELWPVLADYAGTPEFASVTASAIALAGMVSTRRVGEVWSSLKSHHPGQSFPRVLAELTRLLVLSGNLEEALAQLKTQVDLAVEDEHVIIDGFQVPIQD